VSDESDRIAARASVRREHEVVGEARAGHSVVRQTFNREGLLREHASDLTAALDVLGIRVYRDELSDLLLHRCATLR